MSFEETSTDIGEQEESDVIKQHLDPCLLVFTRVSVLDCSDEEFLHVSERVLIHWVYSSEVSDDKVEDRTSLTHSLEQASRLLDLNFSLLSLNELFSDVGSFLL